MEGTIGRRAVLAGGAALAATTGALASCTHGSGPDGGARDDGSHRVVVVGAGLAGLTCALDLVGRGWDVVVLEARDRVGGRVHTLREPFADGLHAEAGGESIDDTHHDLQALIRRFGLKTERRIADKILAGATSYAGRRVRTRQFVTGNGGKVAAEYARYEAALDKLAHGLDPEHPDRFAGAEALDRTSLGTFLDGLHLTPAARFLVDTDNRSEFNTDPHRLSLLFAAQQWNASITLTDAGTEAMRITGGNDQLPAAMAKALGDRVVLSSPVTRVEHTPTSVRVHAGNAVHDGAWLVAASPFMPLRKVRFTPALPTSVQAAVHGLDLGEAAKVTIEYRRRFWTGLGLSGFTVTDLPFGVAWSPTDSYGATTDPGLLSAFMTGPAAIAAARQGDEARMAAVADQFDRVYPEGRSLRDGHRATMAWANEPFTGGGYAAYRPGQMVPFWPVIRTGTGRIRFAGEHTEVLAGYMESAVRSGHRVAKALPTPPPR